MSVELTRRGFLKGAAASATAFLLPSTLPGTTRAATGNPVVVALFLRGAADGLNAIVPHGDGRYYTLRPDIGVPSGDELDLDGFYGLNPALGPLLPLFQNGQLDVIHAVGSPDGSRSHFDAQDFMEKGALSDPNTVDGWLNRYLLQAGGGDRLAGISLTHTPAFAMVGNAPALTFPSLAAFTLKPPSAEERRVSLEARYSLLNQSPLATGVLDALSAVDEISAVPRSTSVVYPASPLGTALKDAAALIRADIGVRVVTVDAGGWDTHSNEVNQLGGLLGDLGASLAAFHQDLGTHADRTLLLSMTEFGRMAAQNGGGGSDHGHASFMLALGTSQARGRVLTNGGWPGLAPEDLFEGRDLEVTTDFRDVFSEVLDAHLGIVDPSGIFPSFTADPARYPGLFS